MVGKTLYKFLGFWWTSGIDEPLPSFVSGPYCLDCQSDLEIPSEILYEKYGGDYNAAEHEWIGMLTCDLCGKKYTLKEPIYTLKYKVSLKMKSNYRSNLEKISLEEPLTSVKVRDQDDKYFLAAEIGQKDGKRVGVVYFGEKNKDQQKKDYSQMFIDLDDEQLRFDKSNKHPKDILAKFEVEFNETALLSRFKKLRH